jgi:hypothetical protein
MQTEVGRLVPKNEEFYVDVRARRIDFAELLTTGGQNGRGASELTCRDF